MMEDPKAAGMEHLYETIEMPLVFTLTLWNTQNCH